MYDALSATMTSASLMGEGMMLCSMLERSLTRKRQKPINQLSLLHLSVIFPIVEFQLSPVDLPPLSIYKAADFTQKPRIGSFWHAAEHKLMDGHYQYLAQMPIPREVST